MWLTNRSWELWGICVLFVLSASFSTITTGQLSTCVQFCPVIILLLLLNYLIAVRWINELFIWIDFVVDWSIMCFFPSKAFRWQRPIGELVLKRVLKHILLTCSLFFHQHKCDFTGFHVQTHWFEVLKLWRVKDQGFLSTFIRTIWLFKWRCVCFIWSTRLQTPQRIQIKSLGLGIKTSQDIGYTYSQDQNTQLCIIIEGNLTWTIKSEVKCLIKPSTFLQR